MTDTISLLELLVGIGLVPFIFTSAISTYIYNGDRDAVTREPGFYKNSPKHRATKLKLFTEVRKLTTMLAYAVAIVGLMTVPARDGNPYNYAALSVICAIIYSLIMMGIDTVYGLVVREQNRHDLRAQMLEERDYMIRELKDTHGIRCE